MERRSLLEMENDQSQDARNLHFDFFKVTETQVFPGSFQNSHPNSIYSKTDSCCSLITQSKINQRTMANEDGKEGLSTMKSNKFIG